MRRESFLFISPVFTQGMQLLQLCLVSDNLFKEGILKNKGQDEDSVHSASLIHA